MKHTVTVFIDGNCQIGEFSQGKTKLFRALSHFGDPTWLDEPGTRMTNIMDFGKCTRGGVYLQVHVRARTHKNEIIKGGGGVGVFIVV
jgi:hypothetical protein